MFCVEKRYPHFINKKDELRTKNTLKFQVHQIILYLLLAGSKKQKEKHYMKNKLQRYFPIIRTRKEILNELRDNDELWSQFESWEEENQEEYLDICTGVKGVKVLYDTFFKAVMNPDTRPERLNDFLSTVLGRTVKILKVLPNESARIAAESSLLVMDIVVQFEDGSIANVEVQKIGYLFPGERSACYSADMLLRQYKRVRRELGKKFHYRDIKKVYTIVLFEKSNSVFKSFSKDIYIHRFQQQSDSGIELNLLQEYTFICLDIFDNIIHNEGRKIDGRLEEWLVFLKEDDPDMIIKLLEQNSEFRDIYEEIYNICRNSERMMGMFSKELEILDRNTVKLMIDELDEALGEEREKVKAIKQERETLKAEKESLEAEMQEAKAEKESLETEIQRTKDEMKTERKRAEEAEKELIRLRAELEKLRK